MPFGGLLTVGLIAGGTGLIGAGIQAHQTNKAVKAQTDASDKALDLQKDIYQQQVANLAPFRNAGVAGVNALPAFLGLSAQGLGTIGQGASMAGSVFGGNGTTPGLTRNSSANYPMEMGAISDPSKNGGFAGQVPGTATLGSTSYQPNPQAPGYGPQSSPIPNMRVEGPNGTVYVVPANQVGEAQQNGGRVLGPA